MKPSKAQSAAGVGPAPLAEWTSTLPGRPNVKALVAALDAAVAAKPCLRLHRGQALCLEVLLETGAPAWRQHGRLRKRLDQPADKHHLSAPSSAILGSLCARKLSLLKVLAAGQIVMSTATKVPNVVPGESRLTVRLIPLGRKAKKDEPDFRSKLLVWYLETMRAEGRTPTRRHYEYLLKSLRGTGSGLPPMSIEDIRKGFATLQAGQAPQL